jgi:hypothetical protein
MLSRCLALGNVKKASCVRTFVRPTTLTFVLGVSTFPTYISPGTFLGQQKIWIGGGCDVVQACCASFRACAHCGVTLASLESVSLCGNFFRDYLLELFPVVATGWASTV